MEKLTAEIIKDQMIGQTAGHMAHIPNSPIIFSIFEVYYKLHGGGGSDDETFINFLDEMLQALKG